MKIKEDGDEKPDLRDADRGGDRRDRERRDRDPKDGERDRDRNRDRDRRDSGA